MWCARSTRGTMKAADGERFPLQSLRDLFDAMKASGRVLKTGKPLNPSRKDKNGLFFALQLTQENNTQQKRNARLRPSNDPAASSPSRSRGPRSSRAAASQADEIPIVYVVKTSLRGPLMVADGEITTVFFDNKACGGKASTFGSSGGYHELRADCSTGTYDTLRDATKDMIKSLGTQAQRKSSLASTAYNTKGHLYACTVGNKFSSGIVKLQSSASVSEVLTLAWARAAEGNSEILYLLILTDHDDPAVKLQSKHGKTQKMKDLAHEVCVLLSGERRR